jgi:hypothetical protein
VRLALNQFLRALELFLVVAYQKPHEDIRIDPEHQRESASTGSAFRPFL